MHQNTSSGCRSRANRPVAWWATTAWWTWIAPFGLPVVPGGEVQQRRCPPGRSARSGPADAVASAAARGRATPASGSSSPSPVHDQHVARGRGAGRAGRRPASVERGGGHQHPPLPRVEALVHRARARTRRTAGRTRHRAAGSRGRRRTARGAGPQGEDPLARLDAEPGQHGGEPGGPVGELRVGEVGAPAVPAQEPQRDLVAAAGGTWRSTASWAMLSPPPSGRPSIQDAATSQVNAGEVVSLGGPSPSGLALSSGMALLVVRRARFRSVRPRSIRPP